jgi:hypothetical protein
VRLVLTLAHCSSIHVVRCDRVGWCGWQGCVRRVAAAATGARRGGSLGACGVPQPRQHGAKQPCEDCRQGVKGSRAASAILLHQHTRTLTLIRAYQNAPFCGLRAVGGAGGQGTGAGGRGGGCGRLRPGAERRRAHAAAPAGGHGGRQPGGRAAQRGLPCAGRRAQLAAGARRQGRRAQGRAVMPQQHLPCVAVAYAGALLAVLASAAQEHGAGRALVVGGMHARKNGSSFAMLVTGSLLRGVQRVRA